MSRRGDPENIVAFSGPGIEQAAEPAAMIAVPLIVKGDSLDDVNAKASRLIQGIEALVESVDGADYPLGGDPMAFVACFLQATAMETVLRLSGYDVDAIKRQLLTTVMGVGPAGDQVKEPDGGL